MKLLQFLIFQVSQDISDKVWIALITAISSIFATLLITFLARPKTLAEIDRTHSETDKNNSEIISRLRKDLSDAQTAKLEVLEKLDVWITRFENAKEQWNESDTQLGDALERLAECLEDKDDKCKRCMNKVLSLFNKIERSLLGSPDHSGLLEEMWNLRKELEGDSHE